MQKLFPLALVACLRNGRPPLADEVVAISQKLADDTSSYLPLTPGELAVAAEVALRGSRWGSERPRPARVG